ncbi:zinc-dependent peptidase [Lysobacter humi (ex Lee et al. 2017)]
MRDWLRRLLRPDDTPAPPLPPSLWLQVRARLPWAARLDETRAAALAGLTATFLHGKAITPVAGLELDEVDRTLLAAACCLPLLEIGASGLRGWSELIVYPDAFRVDRSHVDAAGVLHEWQDELAGEAWQAGPLILSWADVQADCAEPDAGFCVAVHEMAHKIDALDGEMDGTPPLAASWRAAWIGDFQRAFDDFEARLDAGEAPAIDEYAAESADEFFAVASEYHFSAPGVLRAAYPEVAAHLERLYGPSPFA